MHNKGGGRRFGMGVENHRGLGMGVPQRSPGAKPWYVYSFIVYGSSKNSIEHYNNNNTENHIISINGRGLGDEAPQKLKNLRSSYKQILCIFGSNSHTIAYMKSKH